MVAIDWEKLGQAGSDAFDKINDSLQEIPKYVNFKETVNSLEGLAGNAFKEACKKVGGAVKEDGKLACDLTFNNKAYKFLAKVAGSDEDDEDDGGLTQSSDGIVTNVSIGLMI